MSLPQMEPTPMPVLMMEHYRSTRPRPRATRATRIRQQTQSYRFFGRNLEFLNDRSHEKILSGPADTGKTLGCLYVLNRLAWNYPGMQAVMLRKTQKSLWSSAIETFERKILPMSPQDGRSLVQAYGGQKPEKYLYPNGSVIWIGGMDKNSRDRVLSSERDIIYINQCEELTLEDWEYLLTRCTGRAGNMPFSQIYGDCNPGPRSHWIKTLAEAGRISLHSSRHRDNPELYDQESGELSERGVIRLTPLKQLTGVRYDRLFRGVWATAEGAVYDEYDPMVHLIDRFDIPANWRRIRSVDFGYTNPFVCQWWAVDGDGRMFLYREIYRTSKLVEDHAREIVRLSEGERIGRTVADHDAEDRATLHRYGVPTIPADKRVSVGIQEVQARLKVQPDGKPRLFILRDSLVDRDLQITTGQADCTEQEVEGYVWAVGTDGKPNKEEPVDFANHGMDAMRYAVMSLSVAGRARGGRRR